jgi:hypothetical protein
MGNLNKARLEGEVLVASSIEDYLLPHDGIDWPKALAEWSWLLPAKFTLWLVNRFADLFLVLPDGSVHMLDVGVGTLSRLADSRDEFRSRLDEGDNANQWFMIPLVDQLVAVGVKLQQGHCYAFKVPPVLGGQYTIDNVAPLPIWDYLGAYGSIHGQLRDVPDGTQVVLEVVNRPAAPGIASDRSGR